MDRDNGQLRLLIKGHSGIRQLLCGRMTLVLVLLIVQLLLLVAVFAWFEDYFVHYFGGTAVLLAAMVLHFQNKQMDAAARTSWLIVIFLMPVFGTFLYLFTNLEIGSRLLKARIKTVIRQSEMNKHESDEPLQDISRENPRAGSMCRFATTWAGANVYRNTDVTYFPVGEKMLEQMLIELEKAEKFIYLEYFIISEGVMWGRILDVLARKAAHGVDVRVMYDGTTEFVLLPKGYPHKLRSLGIRCKVFAPFSPFVSTHYNYRDHRKILVIDGNIAFNGGINLSDEYINIGSHFGHWKDTAVMLKGDAVRGFTRLFLQMWNLDERAGEFHIPPQSQKIDTSNGYVMPFGDNPMDRIKVGESIYMDMLSRATESVCIMTPYLILDSDLENKLRYTAARGVRVRLMLPGIPDKYIPYALAKTHYKRLLEAGVQIYEYSPGFVHAKVVVIDAREAVVGTINFDYRSFCHHFECGTYMYGCSCIPSIMVDFENCVSESRLVTNETVKAEKWHRKLAGYLLKGLAPLL